MKKKIVKKVEGLNAEEKLFENFGATVYCPDMKRKIV